MSGLFGCCNHRCLQRKPSQPPCILHTVERSVRLMSRTGRSIPIVHTTRTNRGTSRASFRQSPQSKPGVAVHCDRVEPCVEQIGCQLSPVEPKPTSFPMYWPATIIHTSVSLLLSPHALSQQSVCNVCIIARVRTMSIVRANACTPPQL